MVVDLCQPGKGVIGTPVARLDSLKRTVEVNLLGLGPSYHRPIALVGQRLTYYEVLSLQDNAKRSGVWVAVFDKSQKRTTPLVCLSDGGNA